MRSGFVALVAVAAVLLSGGAGSGAEGAPTARQFHPEPGWYSGHDGRQHTVQFHGSTRHVVHFQTAAHDFGHALVDEAKFHACHPVGCFLGHWTDARRVVGAWRLSGPGHHWHHYVAEWAA